jgi:epoxyqueuosine reductase
MKQLGYAMRVVPAEHVGELRESIEARHRNGMLDEGLYKEYLSEFVFSPPESLPEARSLIVAAMGQPQFRFTFTFKEKPVRVTVPPTYLHGRENDCGRDGAHPVRG